MKKTKSTDMAVIFKLFSVIWIQDSCANVAQLVIEPPEFLRGFGNPVFVRYTNINGTVVLEMSSHKKYKRPWLGPKWTGNPVSKSTR